MSKHRKISAFAIASLLSASLFTMLGRNYIRTDVDQIMSYGVAAIALTEWKSLIILSER